MIGAAGTLAVVGIGPGDDALVTPEAATAIVTAQEIVGYGPYLARLTPAHGQTLHASDNRVELDRARLALDLAASGRRVAVVSSGDPGVFAMASALFEALEAGPANWRAIDIRVLPGITAMLAASARVGAPLGHDFCAINLSDNLKPFALIEKRVRLGVEADFAMAFYNPRSHARPLGFARILDLLQELCAPSRPVVFARAVSTAHEHIALVPMALARPEMADMRTMVIVGSSLTRIFEQGGRSIVYTPRSARLRDGGGV